MKTISVQQMPNGFEVDVPTFGYWFKVGVAFMLGAGMTALVIIPVFMVLQMAWSVTMLRAMLH